MIITENNDALKVDLRLSCINERNKLNHCDKLRFDRNITQKVLSMKSFEQAGTILCYVSTPEEIDTKEIISTALGLGKKVFVPKCAEQRGVMHFYGMNSFDNLKPGKYNIYEPSNITPENEWSELTGTSSVLCIVPALCADSKGHRLGYGGGYYDRFLSGFCGTSVCLCYSFLYGTDVPVGTYDVKCDYVIFNDFD